MTEDFSNFSESFMSSLQKCQPAEETKTLLFFTETVKIIGLKNNLCQLRYKNFEFSLPIAMLNQITSFTELKKQLSNTEYSRYLPDYSSQALLFELDRCTQHQKFHQSAQETSQNEEIKIVKSISSSYADNLCTIKLINMLTINGETKDYSQTCLLDETRLNSLLTPYQELLSQNREKQDTNADGSISFQSEKLDEKTAKASKTLLKKMQEQNLCGNETD